MTESPRPSENHANRGSAVSRPLDAYFSTGHIILNPSKHTRTINPSPEISRGLVFPPSKASKDFARRKSTTTAPRGYTGSRRSSRQKSIGSQSGESCLEIKEDDSPVSGTQVPATIPNGTLLEHIAISRFFHHYVCAERTFCRLDLDFTGHVIDNASMRSSLSEIIIALGILTLPRRSDASYRAARLRYGRALRLTNRAIRNKVDAKSDEVLMAVILLSFFETTPDQMHTPDSWTAHLNGARLLLRMRGHERLQSGPAYRMFNMLRQQILLNCLLTMRPVPQDLIDLSLQLMETQDEEEKAGSGVMLMFARLCNLIACSRNAQHLDREDIMAQARALDDDLVGWSLTRPQSYEYHTEPAGPAQNAYSSYCEVYSSLFSAEVWTFYRSARLGVNGIIIEQSSLLQTEMSEMFTASESGQEASLHEPAPSSDVEVRMAVLESLRQDVCAGTPFMLGIHSLTTSKAARDMPLSRRTPVMHYLMSILKTVGITSQMTSWIGMQIARLQTDTEADSGGVFHGEHAKNISGRMLTPCSAW